MYYSCPEFKNLSKSNPQRQQELEESRGILLKVLESEGQCIAVYDFGAVSLPGELAGRLRGFVGHKIAILHWIDGGYRIRDLEAEDATA